MQNKEPATKEKLSRRVRDASRLRDDTSRHEEALEMIRNSSYGECERDERWVREEIGL